MAVTMTKGEGVTVFTMTSNPKSVWPPLCQIFGALCYSPVCCSASQGLRKLLGSLSALATIQIMVGLFTIGLGLIRLVCRASFTIQVITPPYMFGGLFIAFGILCILAEKYPSPCLVGINVLVSLVGVALAIAAIVIYAVDLANIESQMWWWCRGEEDYVYWRRRDYGTTAAPTLTPEILALRWSYKKKCMESKRIAVMLLGGLDVILIVLAVLQLCVTLSAAVLGIKALKKKEDQQSTEDPESCQTLVQDVNANQTA